jgi:diaminohydroxyphosphoribosylaminopyrimidine deaminase/5-amino-6-(5-phosphoribosylamino)uracil reductase
MTNADDSSASPDPERTPMDDPRLTAPMLDLAARLALRAAGDVEPNPMVGAVIVKQGRIIGMGHHRRFGGLHAEREALADCARRGEDPAGSTVYCTLEPCVHHGKQPPCCDALIAARVAEVVYARPDPAEVSGGGERVLREAGIIARCSDASRLATRLSDPFVHRVRTGLPWVIAKWAQTIDGRIATRTGESQWISGDASRRRVHRLRSRVDAILTGLGTVSVDDPLLTARGVRRVRRIARRIVIDRDLDIDEDRRILRTARETPTLIACNKDLLTSGIVEAKRARLESMGVEFVGVPERLSDAGRLRLDMLLEAVSAGFGVTNLLVEAGPGLLGALFEEDLIREAIVYVAPMLLGDAEAMAAATGRIAERLSQGRRFELCRARRVGDDLELTYRRVTES